MLTNQDDIILFYHGERRSRNGRSRRSGRDFRLAGIYNAVNHLQGPKGVEALEGVMIGGGDKKSQIFLLIEKEGISLYYALRNATIPYHRMIYLTN